MDKVVFISGFVNGNANNKQIIREKNGTKLSPNHKVDIKIEISKAKRKNKNKKVYTRNYKYPISTARRKIGKVLKGRKSELFVAIKKRVHFQLLHTVSLEVLGASLPLGLGLDSTHRTLITSDIARSN